MAQAEDAPLEAQPAAVLAAGKCPAGEDEADADVAAETFSCSTAEGHLHRACGESIGSSREEPPEPSEVGDACSADGRIAERRAAGEGPEADEPRKPAQPLFPPGNNGVQVSLWPLLPLSVPFCSLPSPGELVLRDLLSTLDVQMALLREAQGRLVSAVERACKEALGRGFERLALVGSAALAAETPGSDVDVVCVTRRDGKEAPGAFCGIHKKVHQALLAWAKAYPLVDVEMIDEARVPILRLVCGARGPPGVLGPVVVEVSFDQQGPIDHVEWFRAAGVAPELAAQVPAWAPLVTSMLRCIKWWLRVRQIPRNKEGGLPTMTWLLMAAHVFSMADVRQQANPSVRPTAALLEMLCTFFTLYSSRDGLNGALSFSLDGKGGLVSSLEPRRRRRSPWGDFVVRDPTRDPSETTLAPRMPPATQLLLAAELGRAAERLSSEMREKRDGSWEAALGSAETVVGLFAPRPEGLNTLAPNIEGTCGTGAIVLLGDPNRDLGQLEVAFIDSAVPRAGWRAPFLHRADERSELYVRLCDVDERTGSCRLRKSTSTGKMVLCPCHFVCGVALGQKSSRGRLNPDDLELYNRMRQLLSDMEARQQCDRAADDPEAEGSDDALEETLEDRRPAALLRSAVKAAARQAHNANRRKNKNPSASRAKAKAAAVAKAEPDVSGTAPVASD